MVYPSVDALQKVLTDEVFHYAVHPKKAAGRALGTLVEVITFYTLRSWNFRDSIAIERHLPEYANAEITHNVEYSLHPILNSEILNFPLKRLPITAAKISQAAWGADRKTIDVKDTDKKLLTTDGILRNACTVAEAEVGPYVAHLDHFEDSSCAVSLALLHSHPYAIFECKRVGVEEGAKKGPQTIEKAKQGAYVARAVSALQKLRLKDGTLAGVIQQADGTIAYRPYDQMLREVIGSDDSNLLQGFILTVGVVSNHGNWFTQQNQNKEIKVLAQSYDWLLFLTDGGLADFVSELLLEPTPELEPARRAFLASYAGTGSGNRFTKVQMDVDADRVLREYFQQHQERIESWFNIITPGDASFAMLRDDLRQLSQKDWKGIFSL